MAAEWQSVELRKNVIAVHGGYLGSSKLFIEAIVLDGDDRNFMVLCRLDRDLARFLGFDNSVKHSWGDNGFLEHMSFVRDAEVDKRIMDHKLKNDPMAAKARRQAIKIRDRIKSFSEANLPRVIEIEFQAFTDATDGTEIPAHTMSELHVFRVFMAVRSRHVAWQRN